MGFLQVFLGPKPIDRETFATNSDDTNGNVMSFSHDVSGH